MVSRLVRPLLVGWNGVGPAGLVRARCWVLRDRTTLPFRGGGDGFLQTFTEAGGCWWVWGFWPSVENYIVDASILD